ncbi:hypothetical protein JN853_20515 [Pseudomonas syringae pv. actinidiae ICMP 9853]|nr:hypothetical protein JN853_20515 [Pseudomonas syringae pv. actinidiae ICMP 9853]AQX60180.1 hypothetical protein B1R35_20285 [Pseudomonas syringae pv. actinidiae]AQX65293.1 hypothetical protein B1F85_15630 [Pseudomonas syringae pv. actinidiae]PBK53571.1 hypothetical protein BUE60_12795 [Pseudomonas syringae pv. actinidiae]PBK53920.1 hypothetical protein BUE61_11390 [Pseudomonas syringae pv. actinidiae]
MLYIMDAELIEGNYVLYQGDLSTNRVCCWEKLMHPGHVCRSLGRVWSGASLNLQKRCACRPSGQASTPMIARIRQLLKAWDKNETICFLHLGRHRYHRRNAGPEPVGTI